MALSFSAHIRPLFRESPDVEAMKGYGLDLSSYEEVKARAQEIYDRLEDKSMPCDESWPEERLSLFKHWMDEASPDGTSRPTKELIAWGSSFPRGRIEALVTFAASTRHQFSGMEYGKL